MKPFKHEIEALQVFLLGTAEHYYVMETDDTVHEVQLPQCILHKMLKSCWGIAEAKRHVGNM